MSRFMPRACRDENNIHESDALRHFVKEIILHYGDIELVGPEPEKAMMEELERVMMSGDV